MAMFAVHFVKITIQIAFLQMDYDSIIDLYISAKNLEIYNKNPGEIYLYTPKRHATVN